MWGCLSAFSLVLFISNSGKGGPREVVCGVLVLFALQATISFALGVRLRKSKFSFPRTLWSGAPLVVVGRTSVPQPELREINYVGRTLYFEFVKVSTYGGQLGVLFDSRKSRLLFFQEIRRMQPMVKIYRS